jgi:hypothetical protein
MLSFAGDMQTLEVTRPDGSVWVGKREQAGTARALPFTGTDQIGLYRVRGAGPTEPSPDSQRKTSPSTWIRANPIPRVWRLRSGPIASRSRPPAPSHPSIGSSFGMPCRPPCSFGRRTFACGIDPATRPALAPQAMRVYWRLARPVTRGALVAIWNNDEILLVKNSYVNYYCVPGGYLKAAETPVEAAVRELAEEVSIQVPPEALKLGLEETHTWEGKTDVVSIFDLDVKERPV